MDRSLRRLVRKLHAAELIHLREVVAEQQQQIEALTLRAEQAERDALEADGRADMFLSLANELQDANPAARIGITRDGQVGVLQ